MLSMVLETTKQFACCGRRAGKEVEPKLFIMLRLIITVLTMIYRGAGGGGGNGLRHTNTNFMAKDASPAGTCLPLIRWRWW